MVYEFHIQIKEITFLNTEITFLNTEKSRKAIILCQVSVNSHIMYLDTCKHSYICNRL